MKIIISGASGELGRKVTAFLLEKIPAGSLILLTRNPAALADESASDLMVREADFSKPDTLTGAFQGGDVLLMISTLSIGKRAEQHQNAINAARAAGIKHIVYTSSCGMQPQTPSISGQEHYATEQALQSSGLTYTILRNSWYADVIPQLLLPGALVTGSFVASTGHGTVAPVAKDDCARAAAGVLADPDRHANAIYEITGPELLTFGDIARICSIATGRNLTYQDVSHAEKQAIFDAMGVNRDYEEGMMNEHTNAWASNEMITYEMAIRQQFFSLCSHHVQLITGKRALSLAEVIAMHRSRPDRQAS